MQPNPRLTHLVFYVSNPINTATRFEQLLGLKRKMTHEFALQAESEGLGLVLSFVDTGIGEGFYPGDTRLRNGSGNTELVFEVGDVDAWHARALEIGFHSVTAPEDQEWGQRTCFLEDPNGIRVSFVSPA